MDILGKGVICIRHHLPNDQVGTIKLHDVYYVPCAQCQYLAPGKFMDTCNSEMTSSHWNFISKNSKDIVFQGIYNPSHKAYFLNAFHFKVCEITSHQSICDLQDSALTYYIHMDEVNANALSSAQKEFQLWHHRLAHPGSRILTRLSKATKGTPSLTQEPLPPCEGCLHGKMTKRSYRPSPQRKANPLDLIHMDFVELPVLSIGSFKYMLSIIDDHSSYGRDFYLKEKSDALEKFQQYITWAE
jgi:hypothetical protein